MTCEPDSYQNAVRVIFPYPQTRLEVVEVAKKFIFSL